MEETLAISGLVLTCFAAFVVACIILGSVLVRVMHAYLDYQRETTLQALEARVKEVEDDVDKLQFKA